jgi:predicted transcriptional regulator
LTARRRSESGGSPPEPLPDAELEVMACLWRLQRATAAEIRQCLSAHRPMEHGSVLTLLGRLSAKNLVRREKGDRGKAFVYSATRGPSRTYRQLLESLVERIFGGDRVAVLASLLDVGKPSREELEAMKALLDDLEKRRNQTGVRP